jgi:hypothetical protein
LPGLYAGEQRRIGTDQPEILKDTLYL